MTFKDSPLLSRVIEEINDHYPDDLLMQSYDMLVDNDTEDADDTLALFLVSELSLIIEPGQKVREVLKAYSAHIQTLIEELQALKRSLGS